MKTSTTATTITSRTTPAGSPAGRWQTSTSSRSSSRDPDIHAYYFVWNDFRKGELKKGYRGIKWHRHEYEPVYHYDDPGCEAFIAEAVRLQLPIVLEESFRNTLYFIKRIAGRTPIIIPHLGGLNGGFDALFEADVWDGETVYADTALASTGDMEIFLKRYGSRKLLFGSDFPFRHPVQRAVEGPSPGVEGRRLRKRGVRKRPAAHPAGIAGC